MNREKTLLLHSRYNPQGEADRYIASLAFNEKTRFFVIIEPGLGYMIAPLKERFPAAKIIALHAGMAAAPAGGRPAFLNNSPETGKPVTPPDSEWYPGTGVSVQDFLEREIPDSEAAEIRLLEWRPALSVYGAAYLSLVEEAAKFIKRSDVNARTVKAFGSRWFRNFFRNLTLIKTIVCPVPLSMPMLVTGAGPSLEDIIPLVREERRRGSLFILAVSSSAAALEARGIVPDMVITTDGGGWAKFHLYECFRAGYSGESRGGHFTGGNSVGGEKIPLAAAVTAALPSQSKTLPILPISDGSLWQTLILNELKIPFAALPQRGTVSAAALDLAFGLTTGDIFIAGMDLTNRDIRSHARPYSFDRFPEEQARRLNPVYAQAYRRSLLLRDGGSYGIYAAWFEKQLAAYPKRLYSLGKNNALFGSLETQALGLSSSGETTVSRNACQTSSAKSETGRTREAAYFNTVAVEDSGGLLPKALGFLEKAVNDPRYSAALRGELISLLFPGGNPPRDELLGAIRSLARGNPGG